MTHYVIGFLRKDISGNAWPYDHARIHAHAAEHRWSVMLVYFGDPTAGSVINRLMTLAYSRDVHEVIAPSAEHFEPGDIAALVKIADVICVDTDTRYSTGSLTLINPNYTEADGPNFGSIR